MVWTGKWFEDLEEKDELISHLINDKAVFRTAPATQGLLNTVIFNPVWFKVF